jgi:Ca2+-binding EF-hand superfamily protein
MRALLPVALLALAACGPASAQQFDGSRIIQQFGQADLNADGSVTREEFRNHRKTQFARADRNGDGFVSDDDVPAVVQSRLRNRLGGKKPGEMIIPQFDRNGDAKLSEAEFVDGPTLVFDTVDANGDGKATREEITNAQSRFGARN